MTSPQSSQAKRLSLRPEWRENRISFVASIKEPSPGTQAPKPSQMDLQSPLTQDDRPEVFEPKILTLYRELFRDTEDGELDEGFWRELFLLKPDIPRLQRILDAIDAEHLLHIRTLAVFFSFVLAKRYTNPSADIIEVLAGLNNVDTVFSDLVSALEQAIKDGRDVNTRQKAVRATIAVVAGGYQTALVSYFIYKDFFPALMQLIQTIDNPLRAADPFLLAGLLASYDKFESHNQYRVRMADFVNDEAMRQVVDTIGWNCTLLRERYIAVQDDTPAAWSLGGTLSYVGLGALAGAKPVAPALTEEEQKTLFIEQPGSQAALMLSLYDFIQANKLFCQWFITSPASDKDHPTAFSAFLSYASYLFQHAFRTTRASCYAYLILLILLTLAEDPTTSKLFSETTAPVRLCRQRPPHLPLPKSDRTYTAVLVDLLVDGINHNLRKHLDTAFYLQSIKILSRLLLHLSKTHTKLLYHWSELWRSMLSFLRFLNTYAEDLKSLGGIHELAQGVVDLLTLALTTGEAFLPDAASYDDLYYKLIESGDILVKFRDTYRLGRAEEKGSSINTLIGVSKHYQELIEERHGSKSSALSPREVSKIIKTGYDTLSIEAKEGLDHFEAFREADYKAELKKILRVVVADGMQLVA